MLSLKNIIKEYGSEDNKVLALRGVSLDFRRNEFVSILGPSGCGKTTLLNIIGGLDRYTSGDLIIEGKSTKDYVDKDWDAYRNNCVGFVFQSYNLIPHQTVLANVELALELSGISKQERKSRSLAVLEKVGLTDQANKKPNQLSGGQMQRVAIARALVNNPEIILADEPTGALDTETSIQIMELLKEVAKDRLVIMVTHNPELAERYSTRIINLLDGEKVGDSNPYGEGDNVEHRVARKPKMGFKTAFALSLKNLFSKKARTTLTSVAGSIGIIGVALVLALSNGFNIYMARMQTDTLATYPLTISESSVDLSSMDEIYNQDLKDKYPELDNVIVETMFEKLTGMLKNNDLSDEFLAYLEATDPAAYYAIQYGYGFDMNDYFYTNITVNSEEPRFISIDMMVDTIQAAFEENLQTAMGMSTDFVRQYIPTIQEMPDSKELVTDQYDVLYGTMPTFESANANEIVLVVDEYNGVSDITLALLGYLSAEFDSENNTFKFEEKEHFSIEEVVGKSFYLAKNEIMFGQVGGNYAFIPVSESNPKLEKLTITGILRAKEKVNGILKTGIAYTPALTKKVVTENATSAISDAARAAGFISVIGANGAENLTLRQLAGNSRPSQISIYAKDFDSKNLIRERLDAWNNQFEDGDKRIIAYSDMMSMMFGMLNTMVNAVTYVLVAFSSISLIVSSVMIGIITYISVVERTKEIGVLRSLGAAKHEISNVFNAETFLIGLFAGLFGVAVTYLLSIPINLILSSLIADVGSLAVLSPISALVLVVISVCLTLIAGLIPAGIAAKKDPVVALRTE